ncbi:MAG: hypothetical protein ACRCUA_02535 [Fusobacteriaceae bacterium]
MIFYDEFIKKINADGIKKYKNIEKFGLEISKVIMWMGTGVPILLIAFYQIYIGYISGYKIVNLGFGTLFLLIGIKHLKNIFTYSIKIDRENKILHYEKVKIDLSELDSCILSEGSLGKKGKFQIMLDIVTKEKKQYIIPIMMTRKFDFVKIIKELSGSNFKIIK